MSNEKKSWDDIPSLDMQDLKIDWSFQPENPLGKRDSDRLADKDLTRMFGVPCIPVKIASVGKIAKGLLQDISESGLAVRVQEPLALEEKIRIGFFLGDFKVICEGTVRHVSQGRQCFTCGIRLNDLNPEVKEHIHGLYTAINLK